MNIAQVKFEVKQTIEYNLTTTRNVDKLTPMIWGGPGLGKSFLVYQIGKELGYEVIDLRLATINPVDARGFPAEDKENGKGKFLLPYYFPVGDQNRKLILFLDELPSALPSNQLTGYELCQDYAIGGQPLPHEVMIVAAGNREEDGGIFYEMPRPLQNRLQHLTLNASLAEFKSYAIKGGLRQEIVGFLTFKPELLNDDKPLEVAFPTPRSWEKLSKRTGNGEFRKELVESIIGYRAASAFMSYLAVYKDLPDLDAALEHRIPFKNGEKSVMYAFISGLAYRVLKDPEAYKLNNFAYLMTEMPRELKFLGLNMLMQNTDFVADYLVPNLSDLEELEKVLDDANLL